jgi:acyl carrier protein
MILMSVANVDLVAAAFRSAMRLSEAFELNDAMSFGDVPGWDSLGHMNLVVELESRLGITLGMEDVAMIDSVGAVRKVVARQQNG